MSGSNDSGDTNNVLSQSSIGKASPADVADELTRLLNLQTHADDDVLNFGADDFASLKTSALLHRDQNTQRMYLQSVALKENLLKPSVSAVDAEASERGGATTSGDTTPVAKAKDQGKEASSDVARELSRLLTLHTSEGDGVNFGADVFHKSRAGKKNPPVTQQRGEPRLKLLRLPATVWRGKSDCGCKP